MTEDAASADVVSRTRALSPDAGGGSERKRRRKVLSCYDCRRRKLQCDRAMPACSRCTKAGQASNCLYLEDPSEAPARDTEVASSAPTAAVKTPLFGQTGRTTQSNGTTGDVLARLEFQDARIKELEAALARAGGHEAVTRLKTTGVAPNLDANVRSTDLNAPGHDRETILLRGKSFKTKFHGSTHPGALIAHIPELHAFTRDTFEQFPALSRIREDMHNLERRAGYIEAKHEVTTDGDLKAFLPSKEECEDAVQSYLDNYGSIYHILHLPSFWKEYKEMWEDISKARPNFVALVLLMVAAAQCLNTSQPWLYTANSSTARDRAINIIQAIEDWLCQQSHKHVTATDFQIRVLLQFSKQVAARKYKRIWAEAGSLIRFCMGAGLHRNPELIRKPTSALDKELRRRVWAAVTAMDLQASFDRGMLTTPWALQSDCPLPSNIDDDDLDDSTEWLPQPRRPTEFVRSSYLAKAGESILLRTTLNTYLNNIRQPITFEEVKKHTDDLEAQLQALPEWTGAGSAVPNALLRLNLWQYLLVLHDRHFRLAETRFEREFSRMVLLDTATQIVDTHAALTGAGVYALEILCCDQLRAALSVCHVAVTLDARADDALVGRAYAATADRLLAAVTDMVDDKVVRFGCEQRQLWLLLAAHGHLKARREPARRLAFMQEAVDRITRPYYKIMACQDDVPTQMSTTGPPTEREASTSAALEYYTDARGKNGGGSGGVGGGDGEMGGMAADPALLDLDEIAAWTFDDFTFNPADVTSYPYGSGMEYQDPQS